MTLTADSGEQVRVALPADAPTVSVVIPVKNEARNLPWVLNRLPEGIHEVVVVDGHSTDDTVEVARQIRPDARIIQQTRRGKGNAMACGFAVATGDVIVMLDADGSADPAEILRFVDVLTAGADFAKGSRVIDGGGSADITRIRSWGNTLLARLVNRLHRTDYTDLCYGYNAFWRHCLPYLELPDTSGAAPVSGDGFEIETLINIRIARSPLIVDEVPSFEAERLHGASNLNAIRDGLRVLRVILHESLNNRHNDQPKPTQLAALIPAPAYPEEPRMARYAAELEEAGEVA